MKLRKMAYILWGFPHYSETFILDEMFFLKNEFPDITIQLYAIKKVEAPATHKKANGFLRPGIFVPALLSPRCLARTIAYALRHPIATGRVIATLLGEIPFRISLRLSLFYIFQAFYCCIKALCIARDMELKEIGHIHTHFAESSGLIASIASQLTAIPYSLTLHRHDIYDNPNHKLITYLIRNSAFSVSISEFNKKYLLGLDPSLDGKIKVIHCGIDLSLFEGNPEIPSGAFRIITVAQLIKRKGIHDLITACSCLPPEIHFECVVIGNGPDKEQLQELAESYRLKDRFIFKGAISQVGVYNQLRRASVFVLPAYSEGIPVSLMEAMAMRLPVISTNIKGIPELVRDGTGILISPGDIHALKDSLCKMYALGDDERKRLGTQARKIVEDEYNIRTQVRTLYGHFSDSVSRSLGQ